MHITYSALRRVAFFCLMLPCLIFLCGFLRPFIGIPVAVLVILAYLCALRSQEKGVQGVFIAKKHLLILFLLAGVWCCFAGIGNLFYQSADWSARNAVFRDLITYDWPVIYTNKNAALVYYIGYWLPSALVGKAVLGICGSVQTAFFVGNLALLLWSSICVTLVFLLLCTLLRARGVKQLYFLVIFFVLFGGLDILGTLCNHWFMDKPIPDHLEWWAFLYQFSSNTTALFWVFNQAVLAWIATLCFLQERNARNYGFLLICALGTTPLSCVGLALYMLGLLAVQLWHAAQNARVKEFFLDVLTPQNLIPAFTLLPIYFLYYKTNLAMGLTKTPELAWYHVLMLSLGALLVVTAVVRLLFAAKRGIRVRFELLLAILPLLVIAGGVLLTDLISPLYFSFLLLECGIYLILILFDHSRDPLLYLTLLVCMLCPLIRVGTSADFSMRASLPAITVLAVLCLQTLLAHGARILKKERSLARVCVCLLAVALLLGAVTPLWEFGRGILAVIREGELALVSDAYYSFGNILGGAVGRTDKNFIATRYAEAFFFKYLAG